MRTTTLVARCTRAKRGSDHFSATGYRVSRILYGAHHMPRGVCATEKLMTPKVQHISVCTGTHFLLDLRRGNAIDITDCTPHIPWFQQNGSGHAYTGVVTCSSFFWLHFCDHCGSPQKRSLKSVGALDCKSLIRASQAPS